MLAFRRLKPRIDADFPPGHFVAIDGGTIIADAPTWDELEPVLQSQGKQPRSTFVVRAKEAYPEYAEILVR